MLRNTITDVSNFAMAGLKQISFPKLTSFTVGNRAEGVLGETTALTASVDTMNLDYNAYVSWAIDAFTAKQANINSQLESIKRAAAAQGRYVDTEIIAKLASLAASFENVGADSDVTYSNLVDMRKKILKADGIIGMSTIIASPAQEAALLKLDEFKRSREPERAGSTPGREGLRGRARRRRRRRVSPQNIRAGVGRRMPPVGGLWKPDVQRMGRQLRGD